MSLKWHFHLQSITGDAANNREEHNLELLPSALEL